MQEGGLKPMKSSGAAPLARAETPNLGNLSHAYAGHRASCEHRGKKGASKPSQGKTKSGHSQDGKPAKEGGFIGR